MFEILCVLDSAVLFTPQRMTQRCDAYQGDFFYRFCVFLTPWVDAHCGDLLSGVMHTVEIDLVVGCTPGSFFAISKKNAKILEPVCQGPRWV